VSNNRAFISLRSREQMIAICIPAMDLPGQGEKSIFYTFIGFRTGL